MTTETERRVPEHPGWRPAHPAQMHERLRTVEYEGHRLMLFDTTRLPTGSWQARYMVVAITADLDIEVVWNDSLPEAEAAFDRACERLREGG